MAVFLDCDLPGATGAEVARSFRAAEPRGRRTLVVATTALSTVEDRDACLAAGMDAFLTKPITPEKLRAVLTGSREARAPEASTCTPGRAGDGLLVVDLAMIRHLAEGRPDGLERELSSFAASLEGAVRGVTAALATGSKPALASAAHRVLSHARMVGAAALARTASDLQEFASAYSEAELADEIALLARLSAELREGGRKAAAAGADRLTGECRSRVAPRGGGRRHLWSFFLAWRGCRRRSWWRRRSCRP